ncbi:DUF2316 family protein [Kocuria palustris]|uniref:DUF2316 family protein n=1 Tax=Kocuria palustris TaxID=71999 RepID=UPI0028D4E415|nr:DUF2316 family protein [Kocuria palustris]
MSLTDAQTARTGQELRRHLEVSDLTRQQLCEWLDLSPSELEHVLQMDGHAHPVTTWLVRDALDQAVAEFGADAGGWTVLTAARRREARLWFRLQDVPPRPKTGQT